MYSAKRQLGNNYEDKALEYLEGLNYRLIERNYQTPYGEIDLIMTDPTTNEYVFVEVKSSQSNVFGISADRITKQKLEKIRKSALVYQNTLGKFISMRIDAVCFDKTRGFETLQHYRSI